MARVLYIVAVGRLGVIPDAVSDVTKLPDVFDGRAQLLCNRCLDDDVLHRKVVHLSIS